MECNIAHADVVSLAISTEERQSVDRIRLLLHDCNSRKQCGQHCRCERVLVAWFNHSGAHLCSTWHRHDSWNQWCPADDFKVGLALALRSGIGHHLHGCRDDSCQFGIFQPHNLGSTPRRSHERCIRRCCVRPELCGPSNAANRWSER